LAFIWKKQPLAWMSYITGLLLPLIGPVIVFRAIILIPIMDHTLPLIYLFGILLMSGLMSSAYLFTQRSRLWFYGVPFCFFYMFILIWQLPWAIATYWKSSWGTRKTTQ
jgi:hyaluronan synthase